MTALENRLAAINRTANRLMAAIDHVIVAVRELEKANDAMRKAAAMTDGLRVVNTDGAGEEVAHER